MYYSYLRGKQYELLAIRNSIQKISESNIIPIIEPVKESSRNLLTCVQALKDVKSNYIIIANPKCGELVRNQVQAENIIESVIECDPEVEIGLIIDDGSTLSQIILLVDRFPNQRFSFIHYGRFTAVSELLNYLSKTPRFSRHIFIESTNSNSYRSSFLGYHRVLIRDGFNRREPNAEYINHLTEFYSDLYSNYQDLGYQGFGDFSITGDHFSEGGGQAVTAVIHITYDDNEDINIKHFLSNPRRVADDVSILIEEAFSGLEGFLRNKPEVLEWSDSCKSMMEIYQSAGSKTNLANIKKYSISHHFELMHRLLR